MRRQHSSTNASTSRRDLLIAGGALLAAAALPTEFDVPTLIVHGDDDRKG